MEKAPKGAFSRLALACYQANKSTMPPSRK
jgi:hypothetical protein